MTISLASGTRDATKTHLYCYTKDSNLKARRPRVEISLYLRNRDSRNARIA